MTDTKNQSQSYHHGNLTRVLIDTALEIISEQGTKDLSLRKIAKRAGVSHAAPYRHFKDKNAILGAVARQGFDMMLRQTEKRIAKSKGNELDHFAISGLSYINFAVNYPAHYRVMFGTRAENSYFSDELKPESIPVFKLLRDIIMVCQEKGLLKTGDPQEMALAAWSIVHGFAMLRIDHHLPDQGMDEKKLRELQRSVVLTLYSGLRPE
ncbi:MAG: TetR/AcrR family transcriptional regulator [Desulfobacteraceae bacterium]|nr:TetR/AcrR family transcriptional regulator [Desulfobacteraceae bacterium]